MGKNKKLKKRAASSEPPKSLFPSSPPSMGEIKSKPAQTTPARKLNVQSGSEPVFRVHEPGDLRDSPSYIAQQHADQRRRAQAISRRQFTTQLLPDLDLTYRKFSMAETPKQDKDSRSKSEEQSTGKSSKPKTVTYTAKSAGARTASPPKNEAQVQQKSPTKLNLVDIASDHAEDSKARHKKKKKSRRCKEAKVDEDGDIEMVDAILNATKQALLKTPIEDANDKSHQTFEKGSSLVHDRGSEKDQGSEKKKRKRKGTKTKSKEPTMESEGERDTSKAKPITNPKPKKQVSKLGKEQSSGSDTGSGSDEDSKTSNKDQATEDLQFDNATKKKSMKKSKKSKKHPKEKKSDQATKTRSTESSNDEKKESVGGHKTADKKKSKSNKMRKLKKSATKDRSQEKPRTVEPESDTESTSFSKSNDSASSSDGSVHSSPVRALSTNAEAETTAAAQVHPEVPQLEIELSSDRENDADTESNSDSDDKNDIEEVAEPETIRGQKRKHEDFNVVVSSSSVASRNPPPSLTEFPTFQAYLANPYKRQKKMKPGASVTDNGDIKTIYPKSLLSAAAALETILPDHGDNPSKYLETGTRLTKLFEQARIHLIRLAATKVATNGGPSERLQEQLTRIAKNREQEITVLRGRLREEMEAKAKKRS